MNDKQYQELKNFDCRIEKTISTLTSTVNSIKNSLNNLNYQKNLIVRNNGVEITPLNFDTLDFLGGNAFSSGHTVKVTFPNGSGGSILDYSVTNTKLALAPALTLKGNRFVANSEVQDLTVPEIKNLLSYTKSDIGLGAVDNTSDLNKPLSNADIAALAAKAPLNSPTFIGTPTAPTPLEGDNSTKLATTAFVFTAIEDLVSGSVPDATNSVKGKLKLAGDLGGTADLPTVPELANKQATLVSGTNIRTINGTSLLGSGNINIDLSVKQTNIQFQNEGVALGTSGTVDVINFTGAPVTASRTGNTVTVDITGGGGSSGDITKVDDTNVTLTLGGTPTGSVLNSVSFTLGWTGTLADGRIASASNWNSAYTNRITSLTTTGNSGASTLISNVLNIPTYTLAGLGGISLTSLSSTAIGLTYTDTTGVFSLTSGYVIPTTTQETNWNTAYTNRITSLTTTGSSGTATLVSNVLNIPNYTLAGLGGQPLDADLTAIAALTGTSGFLKTNGAGTWTVDTNTYLTGNQSITLSGEASGSGTTGISVTLSNSAVIGKVLTGFTSTTGTILATDSILQAIQKLDGNLGAATAGGVSSVTGTANRITSTGGSNPIIDISASYVGQSSITTLGTITTGVWNGTAIGDSYISSASTWNAKQTAYTNLTSIGTLANSAGVLTNNGSGTFSYTTITSNATHTGDASGSTVLTLATVNSNVGSFGSATQVGTFTVNGKGLITAASNTNIAISSSQITDFSESVDDRVSSLIQNGTGITWNYDDVNNTLTPTVTLSQYTDELAQDAIGAMIDGSLVYVDGTPLLTRAALTGAITASQGSNTTSLGSFTLSQLNTAISDADVATGGGTATGTNTGDQTITLTSDVTGSGTGSFATTISNNVVSNAKLAQMGAHTFKGNNTGSTANAIDLSIAQMQSEFSVDDLITLSGVAEGNTTLGTFTGTTIPDSSTIKDSLQSLETTLESNYTVTNRQNKIRVVSVNTTLSTTTDGTVVFDTAGTVATLPSPTNELVLVVKNVSNGSITVTGHLDGVAAQTFTVASLESFRFHSNGSTYYIIA